MASIVTPFSLVSSFPVGFRQAARTSGPMYRRASVHSSFCSASTAPTRRMMASRPGKMPTTPVRLLYLFVRTFLWIVAPDLAPHLAGEGGEGEDVLACLVQVGCGLGELGLQ